MRLNAAGRRPLQAEVVSAFAGRDPRAGPLIELERIFGRLQLPHRIAHEPDEQMQRLVDPFRPKVKELKSMREQQKMYTIYLIT